MQKYFCKEKEKIQQKTSSMTDSKYTWTEEECMIYSSQSAIQHSLNLKQLNTSPFFQPLFAP